MTARGLLVAAPRSGSGTTTITNGQLYLGTFDSILYCFGLPRK